MPFVIEYAWVLWKVKLSFPSSAAKIDGRMDSDIYLRLLKDELLNSLEHYGLNPPGIIFQQDNDPKHTPKKVKEWLR